MKILIAFASRHGSTREIAQGLAQELRVRRGIIASRNYFGDSVAQVAIRLQRLIRGVAPPRAKKFLTPGIGRGGKRRDCRTPARVDRRRRANHPLVCVLSESSDAISAVTSFKSTSDAGAAESRGDLNVRSLSLPPPSGAAHEALRCPPLRYGVEVRGCPNEL